MFSYYAGWADRIGGRSADLIRGYNRFHAYSRRWDCSSLPSKATGSSTTSRAAATKAASIWTRDVRKAHAMAARLRAGRVGINVH